MSHKKLVIIPHPKLGQGGFNGAAQSRGGFHKFYNSIPPWLEGVQEIGPIVCTHINGHGFRPQNCGDADIDLGPCPQNCMIPWCHRADGGLSMECNDPTPQKSPRIPFSTDGGTPGKSKTFWPPTILPSKWAPPRDLKQSPSWNRIPPHRGQINFWGCD